MTSSIVFGKIYEIYTYFKDNVDEKDQMINKLIIYLNEIDENKQKNLFKFDQFDQVFFNILEYILKQKVEYSEVHPADFDSKLIEWCLDKGYKSRDLIQLGTYQRISDENVIKKQKKIKEKYPDAFNTNKRLFAAGIIVVVVVVAAPTIYFIKKRPNKKGKKVKKAKAKD